MKLLISTPAYQHQVNNEMVNSLMRAMEYLRQQGHVVNWHSPTSSVLSFNRNLSCDLAIKEDYDWLLFWDGDISVEEPNFIEQMIEDGHKTTADIVGLPVVLKGEPKTYNCAWKIEGQYANFTDMPTKQPHEVDVIGTGVMLIWVNMLRNKMKPPFFSFTDTYSDQPGFFPEDWGFCEKAPTKVIVEPRFTVKHWGLKSYI